MPAAQDSQKHIAVLAFPFSSHPKALLSFTRRISEAIPDVKFSFFSTVQSNASLFPKDDELEKIKPYNVHSGLPDGYEFNNRAPNEPVEYFLKATPGNCLRALETAVGETRMEICCFISDAFLWFVADMAKERRVPWIPFWTAAPRSLLVHLEADNLRERMGINGPEGKTLEFLPGFSTIRAEDVPDGIISGALDGCIPVLLQRMVQMLPHATAVATNSFEELDLTVVNTVKSRVNKFLNVGPLALTSPPPDSDIHGCVDWLNGRERSSVAYIGFGSVITPPPHELTALAEALETSRIPFLWSFAGNAEENLPKGFLERTSTYGKIVPWAPQAKILDHSSVGVFVTHCGWHSILESIIGGVPLICRPFFGDQKINQRTLETVWGIGLGIEGGYFTKDGTTKALTAILSTEEGRIMRKRVAAFKRLAFQAVESEGSSTANFNALVELITKI